MRGPILVTGAAGFVGGHLVDLLAADGAPIVGWRRPGTSALRQGPGAAAVAWEEVELLDRADVVRALERARPAAVYHLAGAPHVGQSWGNTREFYEANVLATHHLFEALRAVGLSPRVLVVTSAYVYKPEPRMLSEDDPTGPTSPYATSKLAQDLLCRTAWESDGLPVLIARSFNHTGPGQDPSFVAPAVAKQVAEIEAGRLAPVLSMGNLEPKRDIMDVRDTVRAYRAMIEAAHPGQPYNVCTGTPVAIRDLVEMFLRRSRVSIRIEQDPAKFRPNDMPLLAGDRGRLTRDTGWAPQIPLERTVDDLLDYWRGRTAAA